MKAVALQVSERSVSQFEIDAAAPSAPASAAGAPGLIPLSWIFGALAVTVATITLFMMRADLGISLSVDLKILLFVYLVGVTAALYYWHDARTEWQRAMHDTVEHVSLFALVCLLGTVATYPAAAASSGFADAALQRADVLMRLDWLAWYGVVAAHPLLQLVERFAYESIYVSPAILLGYFAYAGRKPEARLFIASFWLAAVMTILIFTLMPAEGPLAFLSHGHFSYMPESALDQQQLIPLLRLHHLNSVNLGALKGLVSAPSFHAASATLFIVAAWPIRTLRWPLLLLNLAMLMSTPVEGTHYFIDVPAGIAVALLAMAAMRRVAAWFALTEASISAADSTYPRTPHPL
ncbi:phosphatase PAP2 family protein [Glacieibacterium sp.]|uniref:phosphatase PAP2 family protein n=1 Tax=Glacieibacterium sp. TaxID=2860237 RepID=UPI003AFFBBA3